MLQIEYEIVSVEKTEEIETLRKELQLITGEKLALEDEVKKILEQLQEMTDLKKELSAIKVYYINFTSQTIFLNFFVISDSK